MKLVSCVNDLLRWQLFSKRIFLLSQELLSEQVEILQGKISSLEDELRSASKDEVGENMGPIMEVKGSF